jgi:hypothetical protein
LRIIEKLKYYFRSYDDYHNISEKLKIKYNNSQELYEKMTSNLAKTRPNCEEILERKKSWALNKEELKINDELENVIASKEHENEFTIYSILRSEKNLIENSSSDSSSGAVNLKRSCSPERTDGVSQQKRRTESKC